MEIEKPLEVKNKSAEVVTSVWDDFGREAKRWKRTMGEFFSFILFPYFVDFPPEILQQFAEKLMEILLAYEDAEEQIEDLSTLKCEMVIIGEKFKSLLEEFRENIPKLEKD